MRQFKQHPSIVLVATFVILFLARQVEGVPQFLLNSLGRASHCHGQSQRVGTDSLLRQVQRYRPSSCVLPTGAHRLLVRRHVLDIFDPLEPLETAWEFYCHRYEILDALLGKMAAFAKRNSVKFLAVSTGLYITVDVLMRLGAFGKTKKRGLWMAVTNSDRMREGVEERTLQKASTFLLDRTLDSVRLLRKFGGKSKFAISLSVGALFGKGVIQTTTFLVPVRSTLISFFVLETRVSWE